MLSPLGNLISYLVFDFVSLVTTLSLNVLFNRTLSLRIKTDLVWILCYFHNIGVEMIEVRI